MVHFVIGILNLELSWRGVAGSIHNKLDWAQILANKKGLTLTIADSTLTKFTPAGGSVQVKISCELQNQENRSKIISKFGVDAIGMFRLEVVDTGVGLSAEDQKKIFGEFTQFNQYELQGGVADQTSPPLPAINDVLSIGRESSSALPWELEEIGPRISVRDTANAGDGDDDVDAIPAMEVRRKPKPGVINAWRGDAEIVPFGLPERSIVIEPVHDIELFSAEVSRALEFGGGGKEDDEPPLLRSLQRQPEPQISFLIVVRMHGPEAASIMRNDLNYTGTIIGLIPPLSKNNCNCIS
eukprot:gene27669-36481_t